MILQWSGILWLDTPLGHATVLAVIDYGPEADLQWVCTQTNGEIWVWSNWDVKVLPNQTLGRAHKKTPRHRERGV